MVLFICITRLASNEIFSTSKKIHREVGLTKDLSAPLYDATKPEVIENNICEGTDCLKAALCSGMTGLQVMVASATSVKGEQQSSDLAVSHTLAKHCDIQSENTIFKTL